MNDNSVYDFGIRLKKLREEANLTQTDAAKRIGRSRAALSNYEANTQKPGIDTLRKLALLYGTTTDYLLGITDDEYFLVDSLTAHEQHIVTDMVKTLSANLLRLRNNSESKE